MNDFENRWLAERTRREGIEVTKGLQLAHAVCSPSRAGALTGRFPGRYCINHPLVIGEGLPPMNFMREKRNSL